MKVKNKVSKEEFEITDENWAKLKEKGEDVKFTVLGGLDGGKGKAGKIIPPEAKEVLAKKTQQ